MNKRPKKLKPFDNNLSKELNMRSINKRDEITSNSDGASSISRLFPHVTKRKIDTINPSVEAYSNNKPDTVMGLSLNQEPRKNYNSGSNSMNFVFQ